MDQERFCGIVHPLLLRGTCHRCHRSVVNGVVVAGEVTGGRQWDVPAMMRALDSPDEELRGVVTVQFGGDDIPLDEALPGLRNALADPADQVRFSAEHALNHLGQILEGEQLTAVLQRQRSEPDDFALRLVALGGLFLGRHRDAALAAARTELNLWVIANRPDADLAGRPECFLIRSEDESAYRIGAATWLAQARRPDAPFRVVMNAAAFLQLDDRAASERLYQQAKTIDPTSPQPYRDLASLYHLDSLRQQGEARTELLRKEVAELEGAMACQSSRSGNFFLLEHLTAATCRLGQFSRARTLAEELLRVSREPENRIFSADANHCGNIVLGIVALREGNIAAAKRHLHAASEPPEVGQHVWAFGPDMALANELLRLGERNAVISYIERCLRFHQPHAEEFSRWLAEIREGGTPTLLSYGGVG